MKKVAIFPLLLVFVTCSHKKGDDYRYTTDARSVIELKSGAETFANDLKQFSEPMGVLPKTLALQASDSSRILTEKEEEYHSYFIFDKEQSLFLLGEEPLFYILIKENSFYFHLSREFEQLQQERSAQDKHINSLNNWHDFGDFEVGLFFTPQELKYGTDGKLRDVNHQTRVDPAYLYEAAELGYLYSPLLEEERLFYDTLEHIEDRKNRVVYTNQSMLEPKIYYQIDETLPFSLLWGEELTLTDTLLGNNSLDYIDREKTLRDFVFFFPMPLGNALYPGKDYLNPSSQAAFHGFSIGFRGDLTQFRETLSEHNFKMEEKRHLLHFIEIKDNYRDALQIEWQTGVESTLKFNKNGGPLTPVEEAPVVSPYFFEFDDENSRGNLYTFFVESSDTPGSHISGSLYAAELIVSEVGYYGSSVRDPLKANDDDWIELVNISNREIALEQYSVTAYNTSMTERFWFGPDNSLTDSYDPIEVTLGPKERIVVTVRESNSLFETISDEIQSVKRGTISHSSIGSNYTIHLYRPESGGIRTLQKIRTGEWGGSVPFRSMVLNEEGQWSESLIDMNGLFPELDPGRDYGTPGSSGTGEF